MAEFVSKLEELKPAKELDFDSTPGFGIYKPFFPKEAVSHPAKANTKLIDYLIEHYTKEGDSVLDCMAGSGSTAILAALHNRQAIAVELEEKFVAWIEQAREKVLGAPTVLPKGEVKVIKGDARNLSQLLNGADVAIMSPPYSDQTVHDYGTTNKALLAWEASVREEFRTKGYFEHAGKKYTEAEWRAINSGELKPRGVPELWAKIVQNKARLRYNDGNPDNIANLKHGEIDAIVTSPPYNTRSDGNGLNKTGIPNGRGGFKDKADTLKYSDTPENIGNIISHGQIDEIITSPPYANSVSDEKEGPLLRGAPKYGRWKDGTATKTSYTQHGEPAKVDSVIISPPYAQSSSRQDDREEFFERLANDPHIQSLRKGIASQDWCSIFSR